MLFLADEAHGNYAKIILTRRHPPMGRRASERLDADEAAVLISQKPPLHERVKMLLLYDGFFSFAVVRQIISIFGWSIVIRR
ncbi:MAG: hypothetical protein IJA51_04535 [Oscillospiraceae bacterium]|nr:hypothetical protein [Oscillospiraceae bacterium]